MCEYVETRGTKQCVGFMEQSTEEPGLGGAEGLPKALSQCLTEENAVLPSAAFQYYSSTTAMTRAQSESRVFHSGVSHPEAMKRIFWSLTIKV